MLNDSIRVFLTVVEKKSFSKAAKALFLTQPAVSFQIQMLEEYYGTRLFDRVSRNIILTDAGHLLLKYANEMNRLQAELEREMQDLTSSIKGKLRIGASTSSSSRNAMVSIFSVISTGPSIIPKSKVLLSTASAMSLVFII